MNVKEKIAKEMVQGYLRKMGFDGLFNTSTQCGCEIEDIAPCGENFSNCEPGFLLPCDPATCPFDGDCAYHIGPLDEKEAASRKRMNKKTRTKGKE